MKYLSLTFLIVLGTLGTFAQRTIKNPISNYSTAQGLAIEKIVLEDTCTILSFKYSGYTGSSIWIPKKSFICDAKTQKKMYPIGSEGVKLDDGLKVPESGTLSYSIIFPKLNKDVVSIDFGEANNGGNWYIYDICIDESLAQSKIPAALRGEWYNKLQGNLQICLYNNEAFYKGQRWTYGDVTIDKKGNGNIQLVGKNKTTNLIVSTQKGNAKHSITDLIALNTYWEKDGLIDITQNAIPKIKYTREKSGELSIGESKDQMTPLCKTKEEVKFWGISKNDLPYEKMKLSNDSAIYAGCISGYSPRYGKLDMIIYVDNILTGNQEEFTCKISENGMFSVKVPLLHPQEVFIRSKSYNGAAYLEPGKRVFQILGQSEPTYIGDVSRLNNDLVSLKNAYTQDYNEIYKTVLDKSIKEYVTYQQSYLDKDLNGLDSLVKAKHISPKAAQIKRLGLIYRYTANKFEYDWKYEKAYRDKHNISREKQRSLDIEIPQYTKEDLKFLNESLVNDPMALAGGGYKSFINRLKYADILRGNYYSNSGIFELMDFIKENNISVSDDEQNLFDKVIKVKESYQKMKALYMNKEQMAFIKKYRKELNKISEQLGEKSSDVTLMLNEVEKEVDFTPEDKVYFKKWQTFMAKADIKNAIMVMSQNEDEINTFREKNKNIADFLSSKTRIETRNKNLKSLLNISTGLATDIFTSQDLCRTIVSEYSPMTDEHIKWHTDALTTPFIKKYIKDSNERTIATVEANKLKAGNALKEMPTVENDSLLFDAIMAKYKGKVVYVDFWATWCGPCRSGIKKIAPLKEEMANDDVVFVYLSAHSSPQGAYMNMIPEIKGEHYKTTRAQWEVLCKQFDVSGIPHYTLVDKEGKVVKNNFRLHDNEAIKNLIKKYL